MTLGNKTIMYYFMIYEGRKILEHKQVFTIANNMALSDLWENPILTKIKTYDIWHHLFCKEGYPVSRLWGTIGDVAEPHTYQTLRCRHNMWALCTSSGLVLLALCSSPGFVGEGESI